MLTLERKPAEPVNGTLVEADGAHLRAWLDLDAANQARAERPASVPTLDAQALRWLPLAVPLLAVLIAGSIALVWAAVL